MKKKPEKETTKNLKWYICIGQAICITAWLLLYSLYGAIFGFTLFGGEKDYGLSIFLFLLITQLMLFWYIYVPSLLMGVLGVIMIKKDYKNRI